MAVCIESLFDGAPLQPVSCYGATDEEALMRKPARGLLFESQGCDVPRMLVKVTGAWMGPRA